MTTDQWLGIVTGAAFLYLLGANVGYSWSMRYPPERAVKLTATSAVVLGLAILVPVLALLVLFAVMVVRAVFG